MTVGMIMKEKFLAEGNEIPKCVNEGCNGNVKVTNWKNWSFRSECQTCITYRWKGKTRNSIIPHKKLYCENQDGRLGFDCPVNLSDWGLFLNCLDLDHIDGDHLNNVPGNVVTLCKMCHGRKSIEEGDNDSFRETRRNIDD